MASMLQQTGRSAGVLGGMLRRAPAVASIPLTDPVTVPRGEKQAPQPSERAVQVTRLANGISVASLETCQATTKVGVFLRAGSRYEAYSQRGVSHFLRHCAANSTHGRTSVRISHELEDLGTKVKACTSRENLVYYIDSLRGNLAPVVETLGSIVCEPSFFRWEIEGVQDRILYDLEQCNSNPTKKAMEVLHQYSFRHGLANSLYCPEYSVKLLSTNQLKAFSGENFLGRKTTIVGLGVPHADLVSLVERTFSDLPEGKEVGSPADEYVGGGEWRECRPTPASRVTLGCKGVGLGSSPKEVMAMRVLQHVLGAGESIKYANQPLSRLVKAGKAATEAPFNVCADSIHYADTGLLTITVASHGEHMDPLVKAVVKDFSQAARGDISDEEITRAKSQVKTDLVMTCEDQQGLLHAIGEQVGISGEYKPPEDLVGVVDSVTKQDVIKFAQVVLNTRANMVAIGNLSNTPRLDKILAELK